MFHSFNITERDNAFYLEYRDASGNAKTDGPYKNRDSAKRRERKVKLVPSDSAIIPHNGSESERLDASIAKLNANALGTSRRVDDDYVDSYDGRNSLDEMMAEDATAKRAERDKRLTLDEMEVIAVAERNRNGYRPWHRR